MKILFPANTKWCAHRIEGDALVLAPDGSGDVRLVARLSVADWDTLAHIVARLGT